jgi:hypothetical protein
MGAGGLLAGGAAAVLIDATSTTEADAATGPATPDWINVTSAYGADPTGVNDSGPAFNSAIAALPASGGVIYVPAGTYKIATTITANVANTATVTIMGDGYQATQLLSYVTGDCVRMYNGTTFVSGDNNMSQGSGVQGLTIDGTNAGNSSNGLHIGDIVALKLDICVQNFSQTSSTGILFDNTVNWTEEADVRAVLINCTQHAVFDVTSDYNSFGYGDFDLTVLAGNNQQDGVAILNGASLYHGRLRIRGNFVQAGTATSAAVLRMQGTSNGNGTMLNAMHLDVQVECNGSGGDSPMTIFMGPSPEYAFMGACYGVLDFGVGGQSFAGASYDPGQIVFSGLINGDAALAPAGSAVDGQSGPTLFWRSTGAPVMYSQETPRVSGSTVYFGAPVADFFAWTIGGNVTLSLNDPYLNGGYTNGVAQRITIAVTQAPSGGPFNITWPSTSSPSFTSPTVIWPGGIAPILNPAAGSLTVFTLETVDGMTWNGTVLQGQSGPPPITQVLGTTFNSGTGTAAQPVTGMAVTLQPGKYLLRGRFWYTAHGTATSNQTFAFTFGGTASSAQATWQFKTAAYTAPVSGTTITTGSGTSPTLTTTTYPVDFEGHVVVTAAGTLQLTVKSGVSGDEVSVIAGSYLQVQPTAA